MTGVEKTWAEKLLDRLRNGNGRQRSIDLSLSYHFNTSSIHSDHLDRFPDAADPYTTNVAFGIKALPLPRKGEELAIGLDDQGWYAGMTGFTASGYPDMERAVAALAVMIKNHIRD